MEQPTPDGGTPSGLRPPPPPRRPTERRSPPRRGRSWPLALISLLSGLAGVGLGIGALYATDVLPARPPTTVVQREVVETQVVRPEQPFRTATEIAQAVIPSIVEVVVVGGDDLPVGSGSGVIYTRAGHVITNEHVVREAGSIEVILSDGRVYSAQVVGTDRHTDLAVVEIPAGDLEPIALGSTEDARVGDPAIAVGNPLGLQGGPSVTVGVISAFDRRLDTPQGALFGMLQTDAPITRGSSGGALVDPRGRLLGITTAIAVSDVGAEGLGFATPVEVVERVADDLITGGDVRHAFLGIQGVTAFEENEDGAQVPAGAEIVELLGDSAVAAAGARVGDLIVGLEGERITTMEELVAELRGYRAGDAVSLTVRRGQELVTLQVVLDERPEQPEDL